MNGASMALCLSSIPFTTPVGTVSVGLIDGEFIINPTVEQRSKEYFKFNCMCYKR